MFTRYEFTCIHKPTGKEVILVGGTIEGAIFEHNMERRNSYYDKDMDKWVVTYTMPEQWKREDISVIETHEYLT